MTRHIPPRFERAFIAQWNQQHDYVALRGMAKALTPVFNREIFPDISDAEVSGLLDDAVQTLKDFKPGQDVLVMGGDPAAIAMSAFLIGAILGVEAYREGRKEVGRVHFAKWDRKEQSYYVIQI